MAIAQSRITSQGQISVPAPIRRKLGVGPGSILEWEEEDGKIIVKRSGRFTSEDIHRALYPNGPPRRRSLKELKEGIAQYVREKYARR